MVPRHPAEEYADRVRWPDGPKCPRCGTRERIVTDTDRDEVRYECPGCGGHRGRLRRPGKSILPRFRD